MFALSVKTLLMSNLDPATQGWLSLNEFSAKIKSNHMRDLHDIRRILLQSPPRLKGPSPAPSAYKGPLNIIHHGGPGVHAGGTNDYSGPPPPQVDWRLTGKLTPVRQSGLARCPCWFPYFAWQCTCMMVVKLLYSTHISNLGVPVDSGMFKHFN